SPVLGGLIAALFLAFIKSRIIYQEDKIAAAKKWVPVLVAIMVTAFTVYMMVKGLKRLWEPEAELIVICALVAFAVSYFILRPVIARAAFGLENRRASVAELFTYPLIFAACLLSFAHGANDVANAVGPLAAIVTAITTGGIAAKAEVPFWVMGVGAIGISLGLALFGPKLIRTVGAEITKLDRARAFCVALSAAITVIAASALGLPVSSTHIAVGAIFGVGFLREFRSNRTNNNLQSNTSLEPLSKKKQRKAKKRKLVRRQHLITIVSAWLITVPAAAALAMAFCLGLDYFMQHSG
ncbi:MAG TPA: anion permease, partial [Alphaproteobacteria bacterium]|nr:anion permease [Alphaproteobacteria bacterium]